MGCALITRARSHDGVTQVGAVLVKPSDQSVIGLGYNGFPSGANPEELPDPSDPKSYKNRYIVHAEQNLFLLSSEPRDNLRMFTTLAPCSECEGILLSLGITDCFFFMDKVIYDAVKP